MGLPKYWASDDVIAYQSDYSMWIRSAQDGSLLGRYQSGEQPVEVQVPIPDWIVTKGPKSQLTAFHLH
jgi:hypothetical protein